MIWRWLERHADHAPQRTALRFEGQAVTYGDFARRVASCAGALAARGIGRADRVGFLGHNHPAQLTALFACARLGAMLVPLNWRLAVPEWRFMLEDARVRLLVGTPDHLDAARQAAPPGCMVTGCDELAAKLPAPAIGGDDDALLLVYTSGTTGRPKAAILDQRALLFNALNALHGFALAPADRILTVLPLFHVGGLNIQTTPALYAGAEVILHPRFEPDLFFDAVERDRPTLSLVVPAVMKALVDHPRWRDADLGSLRGVGAGSSIVALPLIEAFHAKGIPVQQVYGATETCPIGGLLPEGWFATGDIGSIDAAGRWWFTDRRKHVIISGGENIYPAEVERLLAQAPGVAECAVLGRPDARWGEVPVAIVVLAEGFDARSVLNFLDGRIARFKMPRAIIPVQALPRTALGKVAMADLRSLVGAAP